MSEFIHPIKEEVIVYEPNADAAQFNKRLIPIMKAIIREQNGKPVKSWVEDWLERLEEMSKSGLVKKTIDGEYTYYDTENCRYMWSETTGFCVIDTRAIEMVDFS